MVNHYEEIFNTLTSCGIKCYPMSHADSLIKEPHVIIQHYGPTRNTTGYIIDDYYYLWVFYSKDSYTQACKFVDKVADCMDQNNRFVYVPESVPSEINQSKLAYQFRLVYRIKRFRR